MRSLLPTRLMQPLRRPRVIAIALAAASLAMLPPTIARAQFIDDFGRGAIDLGRIIDDVLGGRDRGPGDVFGDLLPSPLGSLLEDAIEGNLDLGQALRDLVGSLFDNATDDRGALIALDEVADIFGSSTGPLGLPDPAVASDRLRDRVNDTAREPGDRDLYEIAESNRAAIIRSYVNRQIARADAQAALGESGQSRAATALEKLDANLAAVSETAAAAQDLTITQEVMKALARQQAQTALIEGAGLKEQIVAQKQRAIANQVLADISGSNDSQMRMQRADDLGDAAKLLRASAGTGLF
jgi:hypothetical protein